MIDKLNCGLLIFLETKAKEPDLVHQLERVDDEPSAVDIYARPRTGRGLGPVAAVHPLLVGLVKGVKGDRRCEVNFGSSGSHWYGGADGLSEGACCCASSLSVWPALGGQFLTFKSKKQDSRIALSQRNRGPLFLV